MLVAACVTFVLSGVLTPVLARWARRRQLLDVPNHRSSHTVATPRVGGIALIASVLAGIGVMTVWTPAGREVPVVVGGMMAIGVLGLIDDLRHLPATLRLVVQTVVALAVATAVGPTPGEAWHLGSTALLVIAVLWIVAVTNAFNFMDGIDGIAGLQALVGGVGWAVVGLLTGSEAFVWLGLLLAGASAGFLLHNWHPATVFMGDAGSGFFGFAFGALPLLSPASEPRAWGISLLLLWPFLLDTGFTLVRRVSRGENVLTAHRSHVYQRLVVTGWSHRHVSLLYGGLALLGAVAAVTTAKRLPLATVAICVAMVLASALVWRTVVAREGAPRHRAQVR